ncbi:MAG: hypothetical protein HF312_13375 [Ignavibacteria bacterium]|jgi:RNA polymerase primary sigma factor|nr:hypothetical protein [Ignavibacteria bacterium]MCU7521205.1 hypothetical protein [Ignavibacteria bacterium]
MSRGWIFDEPPASGKRLMGDPAEQVFATDLSTFIREVIQNTKDQKEEDQKSPAQITFKFIELSGEELHEFLNKIEWDNLREHIKTSRNGNKGAKLKRALEEIEKKKKLLLLIIEEKNTSGLCGPEFGYEEPIHERMNFSSLVRDELFSNKQSGNAGGSHGLGKAVLWAFSKISVVFFNSHLKYVGKTQETCRLIGRANLTWHEIGKDKYTADGWYGNIESISQGKRSVSMWGNNAEEFAEKIKIGRGSEIQSGTSILIAGFYEPNEDKEREIEEIIADMEKAVLEWFWPCIFCSAPSLEVSFELWENKKLRLHKDIKEEGISSPFVKALKAYESGTLKEKLTSIGDVIKREIEVAIPPRIDSSGHTTHCKATLIIRLSDPKEEKYRINYLGFFRGSRMIIKYENKQDISMTAKPFHAFLVCGKGRIENDPCNETLEIFLTTAEPPSHNDWDAYSKLHEFYKRGSNSALAEMKRNVYNVLRKEVSEDIPQGQEGPKLLQQKFRLGKGEAGGGEKRLFKFDNMSAYLKNDIWNFKGRIKANPEIKKNWTAEVKFQFLDEENETENAIINKLTVSTGNSKIIDHKAIINVPAGRNVVEFSGDTRPDSYPVDPDSCKVQINIAAKEED